MKRTGKTSRTVPRATMGGDEAKRDIKKRQQKARAADGLPNGLVEIPGPLDEKTREEIVHLARNAEKKASARRQGAKILRISPFERGMAIETEDERLAQQIADGIRKSRHAEVEKVYDDEGKRRILTCRLPEK